MRGGVIYNNKKSLENLDMFQLYPHKANFEKKYGWQYKSMNIIFDVNQKDLRHKSRLVVRVHVVDYKKFTTYLSTIKYLSMRLKMLIKVNNGLGIMAGDIGNALCTLPRSENIWSCYGAEFAHRCGPVVPPNRALYGLKTASNSVHNYFGEFLRVLVFPPSRAYQYLRIRKYDDYEVYDYIVTHVDDVIISTKNPYKYTHAIDMHFKAKDINDSPNFYLGNKLVKVGNHIYASSNNYVNEIMRKYQKTNGDLKNEVLPMKIKEHPDLDYYLFLNNKEHKEFQHIIQVCQWLIVSGIFDLSYAVSSWIRFYAEPQIGHIDMGRRIFSHLDKYPK